jgi:hypothetical protein
MVGTIRNILLVVIVGSSSAVEAEFYLGGQGGVNVPQDLTNVHGTGPLNGVMSSDLNLRNQLAYGVKAGYYFSGTWNWLGGEAEFYHSDSNIEQQRLATNGSVLGHLGAEHSDPISG